MKPGAFFLALTIICLTGFAQNNEILDHSFLLVDPDDHLPIQFKWTSGPKLQILLNEARNQLDEKNPQGAKDNLNEFIRQDSSFWPAFYFRAVAYKNLYKFDSAIFDFSKAASLNPASFETQLELAETYVFKKQFSKARRAYNQANELQPGRPEPIFGEATLAMMRNEPGKAGRLLNDCIEMNPSYVPALTWRANLEFLKSKNLKEAYPLYERAMKADSTYKPAFFFHAMLLATENRLEVCLKDVQHLVRLAPTNPFFLSLRGGLLIDLKRYDEAYKDIRASVQSRSERAEFIYMTGNRTNDQLMDLQFAADYISEKGYGLPDASLSLIKKQFCLLFIKRPGEVILNLNGNTKEKQTAPAKFLKALAFEHAAKYDSAMRCYQQTLGIDNNCFAAHMKLAVYYHDRKATKELYAEMAHMRRLRPDANETRRLSGMIKADVKDYYGCIIDLSKVAQMDSTDQTTWIVRGDCRAGVKDYLGAATDYRVALRANADNYSVWSKLVSNDLAGGDTLMAKKDLVKAVGVFESDNRFKLALADVLNALKKYDSAIVVIDPMLRSISWDKTTLSVALHVNAQALAGKGQFEKALDKLDQAVKASPQRPEPRFYRANLLLKIGRYKAAQKDLEKLIEQGYAPASNLLAKVNNIPSR